MEMLKEESGKFSAKRVMGIVYLLIGVLMALIDQLTGKDATFEILCVIIGTGGTLIGVSIFTAIASIKQSNKQK